MPCADQPIPAWTENGPLLKLLTSYGLLAPSLPCPCSFTRYVIIISFFSSLSDTEQISSPQFTIGSHQLPIYDSWNQSNRTTWGWWWCKHSYCPMPQHCWSILQKGPSAKEMQYINSPKRSLSERLKLRSLLERHLSPTLQCSTTRIENKPSVMQMRGPKMNQMWISTNSHTNKEKDVRKVSTRTSATNQSTGEDWSRAVPLVSLGQVKGNT